MTLLRPIPLPKMQLSILSSDLVSVMAGIQTIPNLPTSIKGVHYLLSLSHCHYHLLRRSAMGMDNSTPSRRRTLLLHQSMPRSLYRRLMSPNIIPMNGFLTLSIVSFNNNISPCTDTGMETSRSVVMDYKGILSI